MERQSHFCTSADGTRIAYLTSGEGPPLVLVHGVLADHDTAWRHVIPQFSERFTVFAMDRRGRGGSGEPTDHSMERTWEDVVAVVEQAAGPASVVGHSYGSHCVLGAASVTDQIHRLVVYEPPAPGKNPGGVAKLQALIEADDRDGFVAAFLRLRPEQIERAKARPQWQEWTRFAAATAQDRATYENYDYDPRRFGELSMPTLLLSGEKSPGPNKEATEELARALPKSRTVTFRDQGHFAMNTAPDLFVEVVTDFVLGSETVV